MRCQVFEPDVQCGQPGRIYLATCTNEHTNKVSVCDGHAAKISGMECLTCPPEDRAAPVAFELREGE